ncbi:M20/M25/M40 family metallo-hydrolase [Candidatus Dojkabacteria bacterium]|uniref:M20/M25/M40 family metallo-hydrolase n=1 Tax=Candidatus Dojkabacteria bacterium TaxID=2099670 RepID=A0A955L7D0_9BACT|nr:M20/M25/M40 family metallo-hydrolase [Candidatus Dojkabacteria bacterium]
MSDETKKLLDELKSLVVINSHTYNKSGVDEVGVLVQDLLSDIPLEWEVTESSIRGNYLCAKSKEWDSTKPTILLNGHMDTVFEKNWDWYEQGEKFYGPGSLDMKAGVIAMIEVVRRMHSEGNLKNVLILFTPDEEDGMHHIAKQKEYYAQADYAFIFEEGTRDQSAPSAKDRVIVVERKALSFFTIELSGPGGHNAIMKKPEQRHSALLEMSRIIQELHALSDYELGTLINVGTIESGISPNAIPQKAKIRVDIRYGNRDEVERIKIALADILEPKDSALEMHYEETLFYPSFDYTEKIGQFAEEVISIANKLGLSMEKQFRVSGSEANWISYYNPGCIVLDGFGVIGSGDHSDREFFFIESLEDSVQLGKTVIEKILL